MWLPLTSMALVVVLSQATTVQPPTLDAVRAAVARNEPDAAWALLEKVPVTRAALDTGVQLALANKAPTVDARRLPWLADRAARLSLGTSEMAIRATVCAIVTQGGGDPGCAADVLDWMRPDSARPLFERLEFWRAQQALGRNVALPPAGWEAQLTGATALNVASWPEVPPASRARLLEPLLTSPDMATQVTALTMLQMVPGAEAAAIWRRLASEGRLTFPGARTLITVGLARHGDRDALATLAPHEGQLSVSDRLALAVGRMERNDPAGRAQLITLANSAPETDAIRAVEVLAAAGAEPRIETRVRSIVRSGTPALRERWLQAAGRLGLGNTPEVVQHLTSDDEGVRVAAALAVARAAERQEPRR